VEGKQLNGGLHVAHDFFERRETIAIFINVGLVTASAALKISRPEQMHAHAEGKIADGRDRMPRERVMRTLHRHT
jgi:hypothetical protein